MMSKSKSPFCFSNLALFQHSQQGPESAMTLHPEPFTSRCGVTQASFLNGLSQELVQHTALREILRKRDSDHVTPLSKTLPQFETFDDIKAKPTNTTHKALWLSHQPPSQPCSEPNPPSFTSPATLAFLYTRHSLLQQILLEQSASHSSLSPSLLLPTLRISADKLTSAEKSS